MKQPTGVQLIRAITLLLLLLTLVIPLTQATQPIYPEIITVNINGGADYTTITEAIENAESLTLIQIMPGIYTENNLIIDKKITIQGQNPDTTIIDLQGQPGFTLQESHIELQNLNIINSGEQAIYIDWETKNCKIINCSITKVTAHGIIIHGSSSEITQCIIETDSSPGQGIKIREYNNKISDCTITGFDNGILILLNAYENTITNCNLIGNYEGIDLRLQANQNIITNCNIFGGTYGIYIWQNSNNNQIYRNNFWKNNLNALDENNNTWDNGQIGNYWDDYNGQDTNNDGTGDTPYIISENNQDNHPQITMILPTTIQPPINIRHTSNPSNTTPTFTWGPALYIKNIQGYNVRIDNNPETFIGSTTTWTTPTNLADGIHTFYIQSEGEDNTQSTYASLSFTIDTTVIDTDSDGWTDDEEKTYGTNPTDPNNYPLDTDNDHIPDQVDTDDDNDGYTDSLEQSYNTNQKDPTIYPQDTDRDKTPDEDSPDGNYTGDLDDDNDGLIDLIEIQLGLNSKDQNDVRKTYILGKTYFIISSQNNNIYDLFYDLTTDTISSTKKQQNNYLLDIDNDGTWDYLYNPTTGSAAIYDDELSIITLLWIAIIITIITFILVIYYLRGQLTIRVQESYLRKYLKQLPKHPPKKAVVLDEKETIDMFTETRALLQNIQQGVSQYLEKLDQIENQLQQAKQQTQQPQPPAIQEEPKPTPQQLEPEEQPQTYEDIPQEIQPEITEETPTEIQPPIEPKDIHEIEEAVDRLLESIEKKTDKNQ